MFFIFVRIVIKKKITVKNEMKRRRRNIENFMGRFVNVEWIERCFWMIGI